MENNIELEKNVRFGEFPSGGQQRWGDKGEEKVIGMGLGFGSLLEHDLIKSTQKKEKN